MPAIGSAVTALLLGACTGIPLQGKDTTHYLIIGVGLVSVPKNPTVSAIEATKVEAVGLSVSDQPGLKIGLGYSSSMVVAVPDGARDVRVDVSDRIGGPVVISAQNADLTQRWP